jgi:hypothetical protein
MLWNAPFPVLLFSLKAVKLLTVAYIDFLIPMFDINFAGYLDYCQSL